MANRKLFKEIKNLKGEGKDRSSQGHSLMISSKKKTTHKKKKLSLITLHFKMGYPWNNFGKTFLKSRSISKSMSNISICMYLYSLNMCLPLLASSYPNIQHVGSISSWSFPPIHQKFRMGAEKRREASKEQRSQTKPSISSVGFPP